MTTSGVQPTNTPAPTPAPAPNSGVPAGHVAISEADHNRMNAELRRLKKEAADREAADAAAQTQAEREAAEARGAYDAALAAEQAARVAAEAKAAELATRESLRTEVSNRGFGGEQANALINLIDASDVSPDGGATAAIEAVVAKYPALFAKPTPPAPGTTPQPGTRPQLPPATDGVTYGAGHETVDGFVTMAEYLRTPMAERLSPTFQERVAKSEPYWPSEVPASSFTQE
jgi:hypothetical protein